MKYILLIIVICNVTSACASSFPKVQSDLAIYDSTVAKLRSDFSSVPANVQNKEWIKSKLDNMFKIDQYMRVFWERIGILGQ